MPFVVDCSVAVAWYVEDESNRYTERVLARLMEEGAVVPCLWRAEFANAILMAERRRRVSATKRGEILKHIERLPIGLDANPVDVSRLGSLAKEQGLTAYDAAYLELANRLNLPLASQDNDLKQAATRLGVALVE